MLKNSEKDLLVSLIIGDGCIKKDKNFNSYYIYIGHGENQKDYCEWKLDLLNNSHIFDNEIKIKSKLCGKDKKYLQYYFKKTNFCLKYIYDLIIFDKKKNIKNVLKMLKSNRSIAIWFMDDGGVEPSRSKRVDGSIYYGRPSIKLCTHCFSEKENYEILKWFKIKYNIECQVKSETKRNREGQPKYYYLKFNADNTEKLYKNILKDYINCCDSMKHKFRYILNYYN